MKKIYFLKYDIKMKKDVIPKGTKTMLLRTDLDGAVLYVKILEGPYKKKNLRVYSSEVYGESED